MSSCRQAAWTTFHWHAFPVAVNVLARYRRVLERKAHVVRHEKIKVSVPVVVEETASGTPTGLLIQKAGGLGYISKRSIAVVAIEAILPKIGAEDVLKTVVIIVANTDAGGPAHSFQPGLLRHIGKSAVAVVLVKAIGRARRISLQACAR